MDGIEYAIAGISQPIEVVVKRPAFVVCDFGGIDQPHPYADVAVRIGLIGYVDRHLHLRENRIRSARRRSRIIAVHNHGVIGDVW